MPSDSVQQSCAPDSLVRNGLVLVLQRVCNVTLHLQARAKLHEKQSGRVSADGNSTISRAVIDTQTSLFAMSSYSLQYMIPRTQSLVMQTAAVQDAFAVLADLAPRKLPEGLVRVAAEMDRCCVIVRGGARSSPRGAGVMRMNEQRLWGALAAELHVIEGSDGPIMRACSHVEVLAFELSAAIEHLLEKETDLSLSMRRDHSIALICTAARAGANMVTDAELAGLIAPFAQDMPRIAQLTEQLIAGYRTLCACSSQIAMALSVAVQASAQSAVTGRLEAALQDLDRQLSEVANEYRAMAEIVKCPLDQPKIAQRIAQDERLWRLAVETLAEPLALSNEVPKVPAFLRGSARKGCWIGWDIQV